MSPEGPRVHLEAGFGDRRLDAAGKVDERRRFLDESQPQHPGAGATWETAEATGAEGEGRLRRGHPTHRGDDVADTVPRQLGEEVEGDVGGLRVNPADPGNPPPQAGDEGGERSLGGRGDGNCQEGSQSIVPVGADGDVLVREGEVVTGSSSAAAASAAVSVESSDGATQPERAAAARCPTLYTPAADGALDSGPPFAEPDRAEVDPIRESITGLMVAGAVATALASGCGSSGRGLATESPNQIYQAVQAATAHASGYEASGNVKVAGSPVTFDFKVQGSDFSGTFDLNGYSISVLAVSGRYYLNAPAAALANDFAVSSTAAAQLGGQWLLIPASEAADFSQLTSVTDISAELAKHGTLAPGGTTTVDGQKVVLVKDASENSTLAVATSGPAYLVRVTETGSSAGQADFSNWSSIPALTAPPSPISLPSA